MFVYQTRQELDQASLDNTARILSDYATSEIISGGNSADLTQEILEHLAFMAVKQGLSPHGIGVFLEIITEANNEIAEYETMNKSMSSTPLGFNSGSEYPHNVTRG